MCAAILKITNARNPFSAGEATNIIQAPARKTLAAGDRPRRASPQWTGMADGFTMTAVPIESVALQRVTDIEKFEIMAIPFFILAGNSLIHGGV